jgi:SsrA-binding protein
VEQKGLTVVPMKMYFRKGKIKVELALAKGLKLHDQREELKQRAVKRDMDREIAQHR